jgi:tetratricopeptide (TPR) repeat protein
MAEKSELLQEAIKDASRAVTLNNDRCEGFYRRGCARRELISLFAPSAQTEAEYRLAEEDLVNAIRKGHPDDAPRELAGLYLNWGATRYARGDKKGAGNLFARATETCPTFLPGYVNRAIWQVSEGDVVTAIRCLREGIEHSGHPDDVEHLKGARRLLEILDIDENQTDSYLRLRTRADKRLGLGDPKGASADYALCLSLAPTDWKDRKLVEEQLELARKAIRK